MTNMGGYFALRGRRPYAGGGVFFIFKVKVEHFPRDGKLTL